MAVFSPALHVYENNHHTTHLNTVQYTQKHSVATLTLKRDPQWYKCFKKRFNIKTETEGLGYSKEHKIILNWTQ